MARKSKSPGQQAKTPEFQDDYSLGGSADAFDIANRRLLSPLAPLDPLVELEDNRTFHPSGSSRAPRFAVRLSARDRQPSPRQRQVGYRPRSQTKAVIAFEQPDQVVLCVRRKERREVLFAKRRHGRGGRRPRRRTWKSQISCR